MGTFSFSNRTLEQSFEFREFNGRVTKKGCSMLRPESVKKKKIGTDCIMVTIISPTDHTIAITFF